MLLLVLKVLTFLQKEIFKTKQHNSIFKLQSTIKQKGKLSFQVKSWEGARASL